MQNRGNAMMQKWQRPRRVHACLSLCVCAWLSSACFGAKAQVVTAPEPLNMPEPPEHLVEIRTPEMPPPVSLPEEPARNALPRPRPAPTVSETPRASEPARSEPPIEATKPPDDGRPTTVLQTAPAQQETELERKIRLQLAQAAADLGRINYQHLNVDARTQYDTAKRFIRQAEEAMRGKNLLFASNLAEKAAALAMQLLGR